MGLNLALDHPPTPAGKPTMLLVATGSIRSCWEHRAQSPYLKAAASKALWPQLGGHGPEQLKKRCVNSCKPACRSADSLD